MKLLNNNELSKISGGKLNKIAAEKIKRDKLSAGFYRVGQVVFGGVGGFIGGSLCISRDYTETKKYSDEECKHMKSIEKTKSWHVNPAMCGLGASAGAMVGLKIWDGIINGILG